MTKRAANAFATLVLCASALTVTAQEAPASPATPAPCPEPAPAVALAPATPGVYALAPMPARAPRAQAAPALTPMPALAPAPAFAHAAPVAPAALPALAAAPLPPQGPNAEARLFFIGDNFLGVNAEEITRENMGRYGLTGEPRGVGVRGVVKGSPAEKAGLREMDVILRFDGEPVTSLRKLNRLIDESAPEHQARLTVRRGGAEQEITVTLSKREFGREFGNVFDGALLRRQAEEMAKNSEEWKRQGEDARRKMEEWQKNNPGVFALGFGWGRRIGVSTNSLSKQLADYFGVEHGVLVTSVEAGSPAERAGLKAGDIITEADGERVDESGELARAINKKDEGEVTLSVVRDRNRRTVRVTPEKSKGPEGRLLPGTFRIQAPTIAITGPRVSVSVPALDLTLPAIDITIPDISGRINERINERINQRLRNKIKIAPRVIRAEGVGTIL